MTDFVKVPPDEEELENWLDRLWQAMEIVGEEQVQARDGRALMTPSTEPSVISADKPRSARCANG